MNVTEAIKLSMSLALKGESLNENLEVDTKNIDDEFDLFIVSNIYAYNCMKLAVEKLNLNYDQSIRFSLMFLAELIKAKDK